MSFLFKEGRPRRNTWTIEDSEDQPPIDIEENNIDGTTEGDDNDSDQSALEDFGVADDSITTRDVDPIISEEIEFKSVKNELLAAITVFSKAEWKAMSIKDKESYCFVVIANLSGRFRGFQQSKNKTPRLFMEVRILSKSYSK